MMVDFEGWKWPEEYPWHPRSSVSNTGSGVPQKEIRGCGDELPPGASRPAGGSDDFPLLQAAQIRQCSYL